jgi:CRISPR-associated protein Cas2
MELNRFMRMMLFFDLPAVTKKDHREYSKFIKLIKTNGFSMMQESVYTKLALNESVVNLTLKTLKDNLPKNGVISLLTITEKQFNDIDLILGEIHCDTLMSMDSLIIL